MRRILVAAFLLASASATARTREVLVGTTATDMTPNPLPGRRAVEVFNRGPAAIYCSTDVATVYAADGVTAIGLTTGTGRTIDPGAWRAMSVGSGQKLFCIAASAQVTGAASIVDEVF